MIQAMDITPDEIHLLLEKMRPPSGEVTWQAAVSILATQYRLDHNRCFCINERLRCFWTLLGDDRLNGWTMQRVKEGCPTNEAICRAVAKCTLKANNKRVWFDPDEFCEIVWNETFPDSGEPTS